MSRVDLLNLPLEPDLDSGFKLYSQYSGSTRNVDFLSCHVSVLVNGHCPHPPHRHPEEELLIMLAGEADLILPQRASARDSGEVRLKSGEFVYYPSYFPHTLRAASEEPANYLMFKWRGRRGIHFDKLAFGRFDTTDFFAKEKPAGFQTELLFEKPTQWLGALHAHVTTLAPGAGYEPHVDQHDGAIVVLRGEVESLGRRLPPYGLIYFAADEPHGMHNPGKETAHYLVFEFHGRVPLWRKITDLQAWKSKFKSALNYE